MAVSYSMMPECLRSETFKSKNTAGNGRNDPPEKCQTIKLT